MGIANRAYLILILFIFPFRVIFSQEQKPAEPIDTSFMKLEPEIVYYPSNGLQLKALLYKPEGKGTFPLYIWNHGSEKETRYDRRVAQYWLQQGFIFFKPIRSGHNGNPGPYIGDLQKAVRDSGLSKEVIFDRDIKFHLKANEDVRAAIQMIKKNPSVDTNRIVVAGGSYGGIQTMFTAEYDGLHPLGVKCFVAMSPAAMSWNPFWSKRLPETIVQSKRPVFLLQAKNDFNLGPSETLGPFIDKKGPPSRHKIFPVHLSAGADPNNHQEGHSKFFNDPVAWGEDVLQFLKDCQVIKK